MSSDPNTKLTLKRLQNESKLLIKEPMDLIDTYPTEDNLFLWYFLVKGPPGTDYEGGHYIGKIMLSSGYPNTPVDFMMLTPSGRFEIDKKICLTNSGYHADEWTPVWNMRVILLAFLSVMAADCDTGISHIKRPSHERKQMAQDSFNFNVQRYSQVMSGFKRFVSVEPDGSLRMRTDDEIKLIDANNKKTKKNKSDSQNYEQEKDDNKVSLDKEIKTENNIAQKEPQEMVNVVKQVDASENDTVIVVDEEIKPPKKVIKVKGDNKKPKKLKK